MTYPVIRPYAFGASGGAAVVGTLSTSGAIFLLDGDPWRWKGVSAFQLLDRFAKHENIQPFLDAYRGYNVLRVFCYTPVKDWGSSAWETPPPATILSFCDYVGLRGFFVELVLLTDDDSARIEPARRIVDVLAAAKPGNLVCEIANEPQTHKNVNTSALRATLDASGFLYSSGDYEDSARFFGKYLTAHTARTEDWPRRAHDLLEYYHGGGPNAPSDPAHAVPCVADEPAKPSDVGGNRVLDFRAYFGASSLLGAGATFHSDSGKFGLVPSSDEALLAREALWALDAFPPDAPRGQYRRIVEPNQPEDARTYVVGNYMVRCQQIGAAAWEPGWHALDPADGILWTR